MSSFRVLTESLWCLPGLLFPCRPPIPIFVSLAPWLWKVLLSLLVSQAPLLEVMDACGWRECGPKCWVPPLRTSFLFWIMASNSSLSSQFSDIFKWMMFFKIYLADLSRIVFPKGSNVPLQNWNSSVILKVNKIG